MSLVPHTPILISRALSFTVQRCRHVILTSTPLITYSIIPHSPSIFEIQTCHLGYLRRNESEACTPLATDFLLSAIDTQPLSRLLRMFFADGPKSSPSKWDVLLASELYHRHSREYSLEHIALVEALAAFIQLK